MTIIIIEMREDVGLEIFSIKLLIETLEVDGEHLKKSMKKVEV